MEYKLFRGKKLLGIVIHEIDDFPSHKGIFKPADDFWPVARLFEREINLLKSGEMVEWRIIRDELIAPGLELRASEGKSRTIINPIIHIDGSEVWWS